VRCSADVLFYQHKRYPEWCSQSSAARPPRSGGPFGVEAGSQGLVDLVPRPGAVDEVVAVAGVRDGPGTQFGLGDQEGK
jgi:hypothetical protein